MIYLELLIVCLAMSRQPNKALDRMTRSAVSRMFQCGRPWRAPRHRSALRSALSHHMTHDELVAQAIEWFRQIEPKMPDHIRRVTVDQLPKWRVRDAVVIDFSSDEDLGRIEVMMERDTGDLIAVSHAPPGQEADGGWLRSSSV